MAKAMKMRRLYLDCSDMSLKQRIELITKGYSDARRNSTGRLRSLCRAISDALKGQLEVYTTPYTLKKWHEDGTEWKANDG